MVKGGQSDILTALAEAGAAAAALDRYMSKIGGACSFQTVLTPEELSEKQLQAGKDSLLLASVVLLFHRHRREDRKTGRKRVKPANSVQICENTQTR